MPGKRLKSKEHYNIAINMRIVNARETHGKQKKQKTNKEHYRHQKGRILIPGKRLKSKGHYSITVKLRGNPEKQRPLQHCN